MLDIGIKANVSISSLADIESLLKEDMETLQKSFCPAAAGKIADELTKFASKTLITEFYNKYPPKGINKRTNKPYKLYYHRTDNLKKSVNRYYYNHGAGKSCYGGVVLTDETMQDYSELTSKKRPGDKEEVWKSAWNRGYHTKGHEYGNIIHLVEEFKDSDKLLDLGYKYGESVAREQNYNLISF